MSSDDKEEKNEQDINKDDHFQLLRVVGFCGVDDSIHPNQLAIYSHHYPFIEWGVLFRPDKEGTPRYASPQWVERLIEVAKKRNDHHHPSSKNTMTMKLAAHLCSTRVEQVLVGDDTFIAQLHSYGCFGRVQINATAVNGVDTRNLKESVPNVMQIIQKYPSIEFIIQKNDETQPLWQGIIDACMEDMTRSDGPHLRLHNCSMLLDESKGTGVFSSQSSSDWTVLPLQLQDFKIGFAGGIGPDNIHDVLNIVQKLSTTAPERRHSSVWIDMESRIRSIKNNDNHTQNEHQLDIFDLDKCYQVIVAVCDAGLHSHPSFLSSRDQ